MSVNDGVPDYELDEMLVITAPEQLRALADRLRGTLLELVLERAATITELAQAVGRPKSTVGYHVNFLVDAGLFKVVRTRRVRAIEERYYGRVARTLYVGVLSRTEDKQVVAAMNGLAEAAAEAAPAHAADDLRCLLVHARIPVEDVRSFWAEVQAVARRFAQIPRSGSQVYGFVAGLYPTDAPPSRRRPGEVARWHRRRSASTYHSPLWTTARPAGRTRWPEPEPVGDWSQGVPLRRLRELCRYWADGYDWRTPATIPSSHHIPPPPSPPTAPRTPPPAALSPAVPRPSPGPPHPRRRLRPWGPEPFPPALPPTSPPGAGSGWSASA